MKSMRLMALGLTCLLGAGWGTAAAAPRIAIGVGIGLPVYRPYGYYGGYYGPYYPPPYYYRPYYVVEPAPVVVQPAPVVIQQPVAQQPGVLPPPIVSRSYAPDPVVTDAPPPAADNPAAVQQLLQTLANPEERARSDAAMQLGRLKTDRAIDPLAATLAGDRSPMVRETAARALGLIGSPRALTALTHAAQVDSDRDVRRSAEFAVEIIQSNKR